MEFSSVIKDLRIMRGKSKEEFAEAMGISVHTLASYEQGARSPDIKQIKKFAGLFSVTTDYLLGVEASRIEKEKPDMFVVPNYTVEKLRDALNELESTRKKFQTVISWMEKEQNKVKYSSEEDNEED